MKKIAQTITEGDHFVCYSEYVKQKHLMRGFAVDPTKISVIPHGAVDLSSLLAQPMKYQSIQILHDYQKRVLTHDVYLSNFNSMTCVLFFILLKYGLTKTLKFNSRL